MKNFPKKIDLHMHGVFSDGTDTPAELLRHIKETGITLFALTDHDTAAGCAEVRRLLRYGDPDFLSGVEFSCKDGQGQYHILGYGFDEDAPAMREIFEKGHGYRVSKLRRRLDFLKETFGFSFSDEDVASLYAENNPGKPHIAKLMVRYGYAESISDAICRYINQFHTKSEYILPEEAISAILASGGIPVLAHPSFGRGDEIILGEQMEGRLRRLIGFGLQGVEAFYSGFSAKLQNEMLGFADRYGLYVTAGSDYHGTNKLVRLGDTNLPDGGNYPAGLCRFLSELSDRGKIRC